jgi:aminoglycoside phosphotransferase (APT) family kinase protein
VLDVGRAGIGDAALDAIPAWVLFDGAARPVFREVLAIDGGT